eukprot:1147155-Pelagomonas_calceolata.AAC.3
MSSATRLNAAWRAAGSHAHTSSARLRAMWFGIFAFRVAEQAAICAGGTTEAGGDVPLSNAAFCAACAWASSTSSAPYIPSVE